MCVTHNNRADFKLKHVVIAIQNNSSEIDKLIVSLMLKCV